MQCSCHRRADLVAAPSNSFHCAVISSDGRRLAPLNALTAVKALRAAAHHDVAVTVTITVAVVRAGADLYADAWHAEAKLFGRSRECQGQTSGCEQPKCESTHRNLLFISPTPTFQPGQLFQP